jgi:hypothetical protein
MRRIAAKFVPRLLQNEQKQQRLEVCRELQNDPDFLLKVVTGDESYDPETKQQSSQWKRLLGCLYRYTRRHPRQYVTKP